jgi:UDPglucose--hexose-1-phosphate uridylyltransferase
LPEFRQDLISGRWVIIATDRARRPDTFACKGKNETDYSLLPDYEGSCPFCPGNEAMTPPEVLALNGAGETGAAADASDTAGTADWRVRVVPNKYPALELKGDPGPVVENSCDVLFQNMAGYGAHEVIIETPRHNRHPGSLAAAQVELVVEAFYRRSAALAENGHLRFL